MLGNCDTCNINFIYFNALIIFLVIYVLDNLNHEATLFQIESILLTLVSTQ